MAASELLSLAVTWWAGPLDTIADTAETTWWPDVTALPVGAGSVELLTRVDPRLFGARGVAPMAYAAFAFVPGIAAGAVVRRTVPAMAVTVAVFALVRVAVPVAGPPGAWVVVNETVDASGRTVAALPDWVRRCAPPPPGSDRPVRTGLDVPAIEACFDELADHGYQQRITYYPAGRFWPLQWAETALFLTATALLTGFCLWWTRHRLP
ncbi:hypothetical protein ACFMQL_32190 [Nonomuraea fastidiosa]|uniref:hypothetical protein n=1 Tax=Nonomuraea TaxID=83681 RepID=UPI00325642BD